MCVVTNNNNMSYDSASLRKLYNEKYFNLKLNSHQIGNKSIISCRLFDISWLAIRFSKIVDGISS